MPLPSEPARHGAPGQPSAALTRLLVTEAALAAHRSGVVRWPLTLAVLLFTNQVVTKMVTRGASLAAMALLAFCGAAAAAGIDVRPTPPPDPLGLLVPDRVMGNKHFKELHHIHPVTGREVHCTYSAEKHPRAVSLDDAADAALQSIVRAERCASVSSMTLVATDAAAAAAATAADRLAPGALLAAGMHWGCGNDEVTSLRSS